jgi:hypothetical protein
MQSSIFAREIVEFGALWHGCEWSDQSILAANPAESRPGKAEPSGPWEWTEPAPVEWSPSVTMGDEVVVQFYTYTIFGGERITRHVDSYRLGSYVCSTETEVIAMARTGRYIKRESANARRATIHIGQPCPTAWSLSPHRRMIRTGGSNATTP